jgi:hypothetical protein
MALAAFGLVGSIAGQLAGWIVEESVRNRLASEMAKRAAEAPATKRVDPRGGNAPRGPSVRT